MITGGVPVDRDMVLACRTGSTRSHNASCALITYAGCSLLVPLEFLNDDRHRIEFVKNFGIPLPRFSLPDKPKQYYVKWLSGCIRRNS